MIISWDDSLAVTCGYALSAQNNAGGQGRTTSPSLGIPSCNIYRVPGSPNEGNPNEGLF